MFFLRVCKAGLTLKTTLLVKLLLPQETKLALTNVTFSLTANISDTMTIFPYTNVDYFIVSNI